MVLYAKALFFIAAMMDLIGRKVPNEMILMGYGAGMYCIITGEGSVPVMIWKALWPILLLFPLYVLRVIGAGDVKLVSVISIFLNSSEVLRTLEAGLLAAGILSLAVMLKRKELILRMIYLKSYANECLQNRKIYSYKSLDGAGSYIPIATCLYAGYLIQGIFR
ncbi:MAG: prepilin peptidase [Lachnospiraceae bacterium]|nr:prepilin peptidase [Lachnospiraceae bacterium]